MLAAFETVDWIIVVTYIGVILGIGIYTNRFTSSLGNYLVVGQSVRTALAVATMIGTELGLVTIAGWTQMGFNGGFAAFHVPVIAMAMGLLVGLTGFVIYRLRQQGVMTIPEYYERRFGRRTRILGGLILVVAGILNMGTFLSAGATFIGGMTGLTDPLQIKLIMTTLLAIVFAYTILGGMVSVVVTDFLQFVLIGASFVIVTLFCLQNVSWQDTVTAVANQQEYKLVRSTTQLMAAGAMDDVRNRLTKGELSLAPEDFPDQINRSDTDASAKLLAWAQRSIANTVMRRYHDDSLQTSPPPPASDGFQALVAAKTNQVAQDLRGKLQGPEMTDRIAGGRREGFNPLIGKEFGPIYVFWMVLIGFAGIALWQPATLRALIAASPQTAKKAYAISSLGFLIRFMVPCFWGICALGYVMQDPDLSEKFFPTASGPQPADTLMATPMVLGRILPSVVSGLVMAGLLAAFMSSHDSYLMAWSASIVQDIIAPLRKGELSAKSRILLTRWCIFLIGMFVLVWGLWYQIEGNLWNYMAVTGTMYFAGAFAVVGGGLYWKRASSTGAVLGLSLGCLAVLGILPWGQWGEQWRIEKLEPIAKQVVGFSSWGLAIIGFVVGSLLFPDRDKKEEHANGS